jgi:antitoxin ParD1/3/4
VGDKRLFDNPSEPGERTAALETWLRTEVAAAYDAIKADPASVLSVTEVRATLRAAYKRLQS